MQSAVISFQKKLLKKIIVDLGTIAKTDTNLKSSAE